MHMKGSCMAYVGISTWALHEPLSRRHGEKSMFLIILKRFSSFSTMQKHVQAFGCWSKYTTVNFSGMFNINSNQIAIVYIRKRVNFEFSMT